MTTSEQHPDRALGARREAGSDTQVSEIFGR
jgi:hypothetical protein